MLRCGYNNSSLTDGMRWQKCCVAASASRRGTLRLCDDRGCCPSIHARSTVGGALIQNPRVAGVCWQGRKQRDRPMTPPSQRHLPKHFFERSRKRARSTAANRYCGQDVPRRANARQDPPGRFAPRCIARHALRLRPAPLGCCQPTARAQSRCPSWCDDIGRKYSWKRTPNHRRTPPWRWRELQVARGENASWQT
jgi:hypothetical protein